MLDLNLSPKTLLSGAYKEWDARREKKKRNVAFLELYIHSCRTRLTRQKARTKGRENDIQPKK
jgi:hypothetical protein